MRVPHLSLSCRGMFVRLALLGLSPLIVLGIGLIFEGRHGNVVFAARGPGYVTSATCAGCHEKAYEAWSGSHHSWALRLPSPENVLGDFDNAVFEHRGIRSEFSTLGLLLRTCAASYLQKTILYKKSS